MNIFQKVSLLWKNKEEIKAIVNAAEEIKAEVAKAGGVKAGVKTTEFWLHVMPIVTVLFEATKGHIPVDKAAIISAVIAGVYGIIRTIAKK